jgi:membrane protease YdiL (CAAX protease family)
MPASETLAVLRDAYVVALLALVVGTALYAVIRRITDTAWNVEGNVLARPYGVPDAVAVILLLALLGGGFFFPPGDDSGAEAATAALDVGSLLMQLLSMLLLCLVVLAYLLIRGMNPAEMFGLRQLTVKRALLFAVLALIVTGLAMVLGMNALAAWNGGSLPDPTAQESVQAFEKSSTLLFRILLGTIAVVSAPLTEELLFRGFLYGVIKKGTDRWFAAVFTAVVFAAVHAHVGSAPPLFILGLGLAIAYELTGCLLVPIFMHAMFNAVNIAVLAYGAFTT